MKKLQERLRLEAVPREADDALVARLAAISGAATARADASSPSVLARIPGARIGLATASVVAISVGGAWAGGAISIPGRGPEPAAPVEQVEQPAPARPSEIPAGSEKSVPATPDLSRPDIGAPPLDVGTGEPPRGSRGGTQDGAQRDRSKDNADSDPLLEPGTEPPGNAYGNDGAQRGPDKNQGKNNEKNKKNKKKNQDSGEAEGRGVGREPSREPDQEMSQQQSQGSGQAPNRGPGSAAKPGPRERSPGPVERSIGQR